MIRKEYADKTTAVGVLNRYYLNEYEWPSANTDANMAQFKYESERVAGVRLDIKPEVDKVGRHGFAIQSVEIIEPKRWTMFLLRWS